MPKELKYHLKTSLHTEKSCCGGIKNPDMWLETNSNWSKIKALFRQGMLCKVCLRWVAFNMSGAVRAAYKKEAEKLLEN